MNTTIANGGGFHSSTINGHNGGSPGLLLASVKWTVENDLFLSDLVQRCSLPHLALVTKGQHLSVGAPNVANPNLKPYVLVHSKHRIRKVLAQVVKVKEGKGQTLTEHKVAIPESYNGYFEILSEDGRPVRCLESVHELFSKFPELCLVRQNCKGIIPDSDGELRSLYRTRVIADGEVLTLVGQFNFKRTSFLRCFDEQGRSIYLKMNLKGKFSPIARSRDAIAGVHTVQNLMTKRLPLTAKLVHQPHQSQAQHHNGTLPAEISKLLNGSGGGQLVVRLLNTFQEDVVFAFAVHKPDGQFLSLPLNAHLKLAPAVNHPQVVTHQEFKEMCRSCDAVLSTFFDRIVVCNDYQLVYDQANQRSNLDSNGCHEESSVSINGSKHERVDDIEPDIYGECGPAVGTTEINGNEPCQPTVIAICDDEIDQLYDYIRGLAPLPSTCEQTIQSQAARVRSKPNPTNYRPPPPPPPPVETIPSRKSTNSFSSPEPAICQSPTDPQKQRFRSPSPSGHQTKIWNSQTDSTNEKQPSQSPIPPEPVSRNTPPKFLMELRMRNGSLFQNGGSPSNTTRPISNGVAPVVPEKRLDDIIYGKNALDRLRRLCKSTEKIPSADDYYASHHKIHNVHPTHNGNGYDRAHATPRHHYQQHNLSSQQRRTTASGAALPHQYVRRIQSKPRPMSMVIPDSTPLFPPQPPPATPHDLFTSSRSFGQSVANDPYQQAYRSFVNLTILDEPQQPPPPPPPYHSLKSSGPSPQQPSQSAYYSSHSYGNNLIDNRPIYHQRYTPRYHYQAAYRV